MYINPVPFWLKFLLIIVTIIFAVVGILIAITPEDNSNLYVYIIIFMFLIGIIGILCLITYFIKKYNMAMNVKFNLDQDRMFIKSYLNQKYPPCTHDLDLDMTFDSLGGLCFHFLKKRKTLPCSLKTIDMTQEEKRNIDKYIKENDNKSGQDTLIFYLMTKTAILIFKRHYNDDGTRKY